MTFPKTPSVCGYIAGTYCPDTGETTDPVFGSANTGLAGKITINPDAVNVCPRLTDAEWAELQRRRAHPREERPPAPPYEAMP